MSRELLARAWAAGARPGDAPLTIDLDSTICEHKSLRNLIEAIPEDAWTPITYWMDGAADLPSTRIRAGIIAPVVPLLPSAVLALSNGGFGFRRAAHLED